MAACKGDPPVPAPSGPCVPPPRAPGATVALANALGDARFSAPVELVLGPGRRFYVVEQAGVVKVVPPGGGAPTIALDVSGRIISGGEAGLLGLAFDPKFDANGFAYLYFTENIDDKPGFVFQDVVARVTSADGGATFDPGTIEILIKVDDPFSNHNGGHVAFGPDGMLYVGLGDGGSSGDPEGNAQNKNTLLGKLLRIDPHAGEPYGIPPDNPFVSGGGRPEIYAYGLRNPWKFSFDMLTGDLWLADVGQSRYEEINRIVRGGNYGWNIREGKHCYEAPGCATEGLIDPVAEYPRSEGISVTGGYVYRGTKIPALAGAFLYGDFGSGNIWSVDGLGQTKGTLLTTSNLKISSFGQDADGEVYVVDYASGAVKQLVAADAGDGAAPEILAGGSLRETGCLDPRSPARAPTGAIAYSVNSPLWSDGADKERWLFVPEGKKIGVGPDGDFDVPPASVAVKTFTVGGKRIETRLFVRYDDGGWGGYSYEWADDQSDAVLLTEGKTKDLPGGGTWHFPSRSECFACHTPSAGFTLGLEARQLDRDDGGNVLERFAAFLDAPIAREAFPPLAAADTQGASTEERARGYLHANCSMCHREGSGAGAATLDLRVDRSLLDTRTCNVAPQAGDLGVVGSKLVVPGDPGRSTLALRVRALDESRMPPLATRIVDEAGAAAVEAWIRELGACP
ncbi:MAG: PQQ-dependent sugar dehydrogenase [Labilithrix sp.]|nr:PQQ-dependent sugar dehydrogenase [Labilithrix sp.]